MSEANEQEQRENEDPREGASRIPVAVLLVAACLVTWGATYIYTADYSHPPELGDSRLQGELVPAAHAAATSNGGAPAVDGAAVYAARCVACHQASGAGLPGVFPPLAGSEWVTGKPETLAKILLAGITGSLTVKGGTYNGAMPAFKDQLKDDEIAAVAGHLRSQWGNAASAVDAVTVAKARTDIASRADPWNGDQELAALK